MSGGSSGGGSSGGMSGGSSGGGAGGGGGGGGGQIRGVSGPVPGPGGAGGAGGSGNGGMPGQNCEQGGNGGWGGSDEACDGSVGQYPGESEAERKARLEKTLEESVGGFDEVLADEQREVSTVGRNTEGFGGGDGAGSGRVGLGKQAGGGGGGGSGGGSGNGAGEAGSISGPQQPRESSVGGLSEEEIQARTPDDIPDLVSEDIVAKQLREAALSEEDPVLRERLWEEYRSYNDLN